MSKKKNTLKDLDEFLKQQAATLVSPTRLREKVEILEPVVESPAHINEEEKGAPIQKASPEKTISTTSIIKDMKQLALMKGTSFNEEFCTMVLTAMETQKDFSAEEKMLINTALYLKHGSDWKEAIRQYWKNKNS